MLPRKSGVALASAPDAYSGSPTTRDSILPRPPKKLLVGESNPGRLRDRQKCYQLHQRGSPVGYTDRPPAWDSIPPPEEVYPSRRSLRTSGLVGAFGWCFRSIPGTRSRLAWSVKPPVSQPGIRPRDSIPPTKNTARPGTRSRSRPTKKVIHSRFLRVILAQGPC